MPYAFDYALKMARQSVDFAEAEGDFTHIRKWLNEIEAAYEDDMKSTVTVVSHMAEVMEQNAATRHPEVFQTEQERDAEWLGTHVTVSGGEVEELGPQSGGEMIF